LYHKKQTMAHGLRHGFGFGVHLELLVDVLNVKRDLKAVRELRRCRIMVVPLRQQLQQSQLAGREVIVGVVLKLLRLLVDEQEKERLEGQAEHVHFCQ